MKYNKEEYNINELLKKEKQLVTQNQAPIGTMKYKTKSIKAEIEEKVNNKQYESNIELENKKINLVFKLVIFIIYKT